MLVILEVYTRKARLNVDRENRMSGAAARTGNFGKKRSKYI